MDKEQAQRLHAQAEITLRIEDLISRDPIDTALRLPPVMIQIMAAHMPANLTPAYKKQVKASYPPANDELMKERCLSEEGVGHIVAASVQSALIALDYFPPSSVRNFPEVDSQLSGKIGDEISTDADAVFEKGLAAGMSPFGVAATIILQTLAKARASGVNGWQCGRLAIESVEHAIGRQPPNSEMPDKQTEEQAISHLMELLGVSKATAKKYVATAKKVQTI